MGRTPKPLVVWADKTLQDDPQLIAMRDQGHSIIFLEEPPDLIVGPNCWRIVKGLEGYIQLAVDTARKRRYPRKDKFNE